MMKGAGEIPQECGFDDHYATQKKYPVNNE
jgi:hypothetical protein